MYVFDPKAEAMLRHKYALLEFLEELMLKKRLVERLASIWNPERCQLGSHGARINRSTSARDDWYGKVSIPSSRVAFSLQTRPHYFMVLPLVHPPSTIASCWMLVVILKWSGRGFCSDFEYLLHL